MKTHNILIATMPKEGHFNPLTSLAIYLIKQGHDVRWYAGGPYGEKVAKLGLYHYPFVKAKNLNHESLIPVKAEQAFRKETTLQLRPDVNRSFFHRPPALVEDLLDIYDEWPYELIIHDMSFLDGSPIRDILPVKTVAVGVVPHVAVAHTADLSLQIGVPGFEKSPQHLHPGVQFVGAMLPYNRGRKYPFRQVSRALEARRVVLATQGTEEQDVEKLLIPTLEAFKDDPTTLVIATTGGAQTEELRARYPQEHFVIEDFIDFDSVMPYAHVYVTNGGYGGVMQGLRHSLPIVVAGVQDGKSEIADRVAHCRVGVDLKTETPTSHQIRQAVEQVLRDSSYWQNARRLSREFAAYNATELAAEYITGLITTPYTVLESDLLEVA